MKRTLEIYATERRRLHARTDQLFAWLFLAQWAFAVVCAVTLSPLTWTGTQSAIHLHVYLAVFGGGLLVSLPLYLIYKQTGSALTRQVVGITQMLFGALLIHLTGGRIETHFHIFGSLAFLTFYQDWSVLVTASAIVALDHLLGGMFIPQSTYGLGVVSPYRWLEHTGWVVFEDLFLIYSCFKSQRDHWLMSERQADLEGTNAVIEAQIAKRTAELQRAYLEIDVQKRKSEQASKMAALGHMAGNIAHEINTPLGIISLLAEQVQIGAGSFAETEGREAEALRLSDAAEKIEKTVDRISKIIESLRRFSRQDDDDPVELISLQQIVSDTLELCRQRFRVREITLHVDVADDLSCACRPVQITQVLTNLLNNAYDAVQATENPWIRIEGRMSDDKLWLRVIDSGAGIPAAIRDKIMQPFFTTKDVGKGTGVGLSISQQIMHSHGGDLRINDVNLNTEFVLTFPRPVPEEARALSA